MRVAGFRLGAFRKPTGSSSFALIPLLCCFGFQEQLLPYDSFPGTDLLLEDRILVFLAQWEPSVVLLWFHNKMGAGFLGGPPAKTLFLRRGIPTGMPFGVQGCGSFPLKGEVSFFSLLPSFSVSAPL